MPVPPNMLPQGPGSTGSTPQAAAEFPDVEPASVSLTSIHFKVKGYTESELQSISNLAEDMYNRIGLETGLYSFLAGQSYTLVVYKDSAEYSTKTKQPDGSRAVVSGSTLYTYPGPELAPHLAHHIMHLVFASYMGERARSLGWLNEGLAMHMEVQRMPDYDRTIYTTAQQNQIRTERMTFSQLTYMSGSDEQKRKQEVWYLQSESVVSFLLKQGSSLAFAAFMNDLRNGSTDEQALSNNFGAKFRNLKDLESAWSAAL